MSTTNLFGTDGIRTSVGTPPLTHDQLPVLGKAIAQWAQQAYGNNPRILLAHDTRQSCAWVKASLQSGLLLSPVHIYDAGVLPSPAVSQLLQYSTDYDCGIIVSASHNPYQDNGIKLVDAHTGKINVQDEQYISQLLHNNNEHVIDYTTLGKQTLLTEAPALYQNQLQPFFTDNFLKGLTIVLDCAHGATSTIAPDIFKHYGAKIITVHNKPNGLNINKQSGTLYPQIAQKAVITHKADIGFAFDGDGDRVLAINKHGQITSGDDMLALLLEHPLYADSIGIIGTSMTNMGLQQYLATRNKRLHRTWVGDKYVAQALLEYNLLLGGEPSGHIIARDYLPTGDGIFNALRLIQAIQHTDNWDLITFKKFPQIMINVPVSQKQNLADEPFASLITDSQAQLPAGRMIVRYSGTEPLLRIMIEDERYEHAQSVGTHLAHQLKKVLSH